MNEAARVSNEDWGHRCGGFFYNVVRRPGHKPKRGETPKAFRARLLKEIQKEPEHFFQRITISVPDAMLSEWVNTQLAPLLDDVRLWWEGRTPHYVRSPALVNKYGPSLMFNPIVDHDFTGHVMRDWNRYEAELAQKGKGHAKT